ncbi:MAG: Glyoxalase-like domain protein [Methanomassiliicoccales archaeon PtaU1.Bin124]|nr:MAG: Glyoxalase-like domain protein [Methanomassiliicoccales archaeon PtaU1.Bin124]
MGGEFYDMGRGRLTRLWKARVPVKDLSIAVEFYRDVLELEVLIDDTPHGWVEIGWGKDDGSIILYVPEKDDKRQPGGDTGIVFATDSLFEVHRRLVDEEVEFVVKPERRPWGLIAIFLDPYGNELTVLDAAPEKK